MSTPFYNRPTRRLPGNHDPALSQPGFETEQMAEERRIKIAGMMIRLGQGPSLVSCRPASPCGSTACPTCNRLFRRWLIHRAMGAFKCSNSPLVTVSAVHHSLSRPAGELHTLDLENAKRQIARHFERSGLGDLTVTWDITAAGLSEVAAAHNHTLLCIDEMGQASEADGKLAKRLQTTAFTLASGRGRIRSKAYNQSVGALDLEWNLLFLSTGEKALSDIATESAVARLSLISFMAGPPLGVSVEGRENWGPS